MKQVPMHQRVQKKKKVGKREENARYGNQCVQEKWLVELWKKMIN